MSSASENEFLQKWINDSKPFTNPIIHNHNTDIKIPDGSRYKSFWNLSPNWVYLDHGAFGAVPSAILDYAAFVKSEEQEQPHLFFEPYEKDQKTEYLARLYRSIEALSSYVHCDMDNLIFTNGATHSLNIAFKSIDLNPDDEILITSHSYKSVEHMCKLWAAENKCKVVVCEIKFPYPGTDDDLTDSILSCVTDKTKVAIIDHIASRSSLVFPVQKICKALKEKNVISIIDGAHATGNLKLNITETGADYYAGTCHKWMCNIKGSGYLYVSDDNIHNVKPLILAFPSFTQSGSKLRTCFDWRGTPNIEPWLVIPECIDFQKLIYQDQGGAPSRNNSLAREAVDVISHTLEIECKGRYSSMFSVSLNEFYAGFTLTATEVYKYLRDTKNIIIAVYAWPTENDITLRVSCGSYNSLDQIEYLCNALLEHRESLINL